MTRRPRRNAGKPQSADIVGHLTTLAAWEEGLAAGAYTTSTHGRTLEQEGFVHCSSPEQLPRTARRFYQDVPGPLVVLVIEPALLGRSHLRLEQVGDQTYPRLYGALPPEAVIAVMPAWFEDGELRLAPSR
ncbi:DUF952 domain-containing protein [Arsenicicoccus sp. MKL-02]|uniref:DUF952 domain-containing protein n=1 Tax=Arsenicicoccus cauae TaxID=2663847 RepID=A0A6I3IL36_9MICO|nr:DUF952 domain-containing protein [Arsenicicoccus cauae]MTB72405.1 DUF952 domain-containing protein [Arsenicicoccus cauae]